MIQTPKISRNGCTPAGKIRNDDGLAHIRLTQRVSGDPSHMHVCRRLQYVLQ